MIPGAGRFRSLQSMDSSCMLGPWNTGGEITLHKSPFGSSMLSSLKLTCNLDPHRNFSTLSVGRVLLARGPASVRGWLFRRAGFELPPSTNAGGSDRVQLVNYVNTRGTGLVACFFLDAIFTEQALRHLSQSSELQHRRCVSLWPLIWLMRIKPGTHVYVLAGGGCEYQDTLCWKELDLLCWVVKEMSIFFTWSFTRADNWLQFTVEYEIIA